MSIRLLKTLIAIEEHNTFTAAAESLHITHAAVSQQMKALEEEQKIVLFDRRKRRPRLTPLGRELVARARELVHTYENLVPSILGEEHLSGELKLGAVATTLTGLVPLTMSLLRNQYPDLRLQVVPGLTTELLLEIERDALDVAIVTRPEQLPLNISWYQIAEEPLELLISPSIEVEDPVELLRTKPFIRFTRKAVVGGLIDRWLQAEGITVTDNMELADLESISSMVYHDLGVSIVPRCCVPTPNPLPLKYISLGPNGISRSIGLAYKKDTLKPRLIDALKSRISCVIN